MTEVTQPVLVKDGGVLLVSRPDGTIVYEGGDGTGLHFHDTRYLSRYALRIGGEPPMALMASSARGREAVLQFSNYDIDEGPGRRLPLQSLQVDLHRSADGDRLQLVDQFQIRSFAPEVARFSLSLSFDARFEDVFELRGTKPDARGRLERRVTDAGVTFGYEGADQLRRELHVSFSPAPARLAAEVDEPAQADFEFELAPQGTAALTVTFQLVEGSAPRTTDRALPPGLAQIEFQSDNLRLDAVMRRSFRDLRLLQTTLDHPFIAGGLPWFAAPFARDSIIGALQMLAYDPRAAVGVARQMAAHQGARRDPETGEEPGKIPHELRVGEMARLHQIRHRPSYLSIDATPLFLILVGRHVAATGRLELFEELREPVERGLAWIGDHTGDLGWLAYDGRASDGLVNQGWKDSPGAIVHPDGPLAEPPIALCEVQGYVYLAKTLLAAAYRQAGESAAADRLASEALDLARRFNRDFWMEDEGTYCLALEAGGAQVATIASNAGHALWSGIAEPGKAARVAERLLKPDMSSGWGVRTLSDRARAYNPLHYHLGSVWPFDNALLVEGLVRYGLDDAAAKLFEDLLDASAHFSLARLPEFYVGFQREPDLFPARCPFAEPLQAWSAGAMPSMVAAFLGLGRIQGDAGREPPPPRMPPGVRRIDVTLRGPDGAPLAHRFEATDDGQVTVSRP